MSAPPTRREALRAAPRRFSFYAILRDFELCAPGLPRIGRNRSLTEEVVTPGQDPWLSFPDAEITDFTETPGRPPRLATRFLGYFGPHGALPLNITQEVWHWHRARDPAFTHFADIFATRFQQLFYRVWADARPLAQIDLSEESGANDRFRGHLGALIGRDPAALSGVTALEAQLLPMVGLLQGRIRSAARLRQILSRSLGLRVEIHEHQLMWLGLEPEDCNALGRANCGLGRSLRLGARVPSVNENIRIDVHCPDLESYRALMPGRPLAAKVADLVSAGLQMASAAELCALLPASQVPKARLGATRLGETGWLAGPPPDAAADAFVPGGRHPVPISFIDGPH